MQQKLSTKDIVHNRIGFGEPQGRIKINESLKTGVVRETIGPNGSRMSSDRNDTICQRLDGTLALPGLEPDADVDGKVPHLAQ